MYQQIENPVEMKAEEIDKAFKGKWVYIVNAQFTKQRKLVSGIPVVVADAPFEGVEADRSLYDQYDKEGEYGEKLSYSLIDHHDFISILDLG